MKSTPPVLPDSVLKRMPKEEREKLGKAGRTAAECLADAEIKSERDLQTHMRNLLNQRNLMFYSPPMTRRSPMPKGWPDFEIFLRGGRVLFVEAKTPTGQLSEDQEKWHGEYWAATGEKVHVVRTLNEFKQILDKETK